MITLVELSRIDDNPYQVRIVYDEAEIRDLAEDIARLRPVRPETSGLIQLPVGRIVVSDRFGQVDPDIEEMGGIEAVLAMPGSRVQLAAGHNRKRAFEWLIQTCPGGDWRGMPVDLVPLDDQAMADIAWSENAKRQDLSAIERARAVQRAMAQFGWKQKVIAERWGMSESALSNTMRLLDLPAEVQAMVQRGELPERHARELLPLVQIADKPKLALKLAREAVKDGLAAAAVAWKVENEMRNLTRDIDPALMDFPLETQWCGVTCRVCDKQKHGKCVRKENYDKKVDAYRRSLEAGASGKTGLPIFSDFYGGVLMPAELERARARNCPNLAVGWRSSWGGEQGRVPVDADAFPNVCYVCTQRYACECRKVQMAAEDQKRLDEDPRLAEYQAWVNEQEQKGKEINSETINYLYGKYRELVGKVSAKERALLVAVILNSSHRDVGYDDLDQIAYELVEMVDSGYGMLCTAGLALLRRAQMYQRARLGTPIDEVKARLEVLREYARSRELGHPPYSETGKREIGRVCEILNAHPGHEELWSELSELVGEELSKLAREISQEKPIANSE